MKVLLTGANGFVGSHIVDELLAKGIATIALLRPSSDRSFLKEQIPRLEIRTGSITDAASLEVALDSVTHVLHCAGLTKALGTEEFYAVNQRGTRNIVEAVNRAGDRVQRLVQVSSLAAAGPATADAPARESDVPHPVSEYGRSKLAGEEEVRQRCRTDWVVLRPPAVYGPRDREFLALFKGVKAHFLPVFGGGKQALSLVFVKDLARAAVACLTHPGASRRTFFTANTEIVTGKQFAIAIQRQLGSWTVPLPLPTAALWVACMGQELASRLTRRANVLSRQKWPELKAPGWVCDGSRLRERVGDLCVTRLDAGVEETLAWYRAAGWL